MTGSTVASFPEGLELPVRLELDGAPPQDARGPVAFAVDWLAVDGEILFHLNPRPADRLVVVNSFLGGAWGEEVVIRRYPFPLEPGVAFRLAFHVLGDCFHVLVDGRRLCEFAHRAPPSAVVEVTSTAVLWRPAAALPARLRSRGRRSARSVRKLIRRHVEGVAARRLEAIPTLVMENDVWRVDGNWIFRFPRTESAARALATQVCLLPRLAPRLPVQVPRFEHVVRDEEGTPVFAGYELIRGAPRPPDELAPAARERVASGLGDLLSALHGTPLDDAARCGFESAGKEVRADWERRHARLRAAVFPALADDERVWVERFFRTALDEPGLLDYSRVVVHGDLGAEHVLLSGEEGELAGIIDFDLALGDPAVDFIWRESYGDEFFGEVLRSYDGPIDEAFAERVALQIDLRSLEAIAVGLELGHRVLVEIGRHKLRARMSARAGSP